MRPGSYEVTREPDGSAVYEARRHRTGVLTQILGVAASLGAGAVIADSAGYAPWQHAALMSVVFGLGLYAAAAALLRALDVTKVSWATRVRPGEVEAPVGHRVPIRSVQRVEVVNRLVGARLGRLTPRFFAGGGGTGPFGIALLAATLMFVFIWVGVALVFVALWASARARAPKAYCVELSWLDQDGHQRRTMLAEGLDRHGAEQYRDDFVSALIANAQR